jgi:hypothetical protein
VRIQRSRDVERVAAQAAMVAMNRMASPPVVVANHQERRWATRPDISRGFFRSRARRTGKAAERTERASAWIAVSRSSEAGRGLSAREVSFRARATSAAMRALSAVRQSD